MHDEKRIEELDPLLRRVLANILSVITKIHSMGGNSGYGLFALVNIIYLVPL
jgi:hypothetical protein